MLILSSFGFGVQQSWLDDVLISLGKGDIGNNLTKLLTSVLYLLISTDGDEVWILKTDMKIDKLRTLPQLA